jgi:hypothetical protein
MTITASSPAELRSAKRRFFRPRFTLAALLVLTTVIAIPLGYVAQRRAWNLRRKAAWEIEDSSTPNFLAAYNENIVQA